MEGVKIDHHYYIELLENLLSRFGQDIDSITVNKLNNFRDTDQYLREINTFYYRSFHESFFPLYTQEIKQQISQILNLNLQEEMVKREVLAIIKYYARLNNRVKTLISELTRLNLDTSGQLLFLDAEHELLALQFASSVKRLCHRLELVGGLSRTLAEMAHNQRLLTLIKSNPVYAFTLESLLEAEEKTNFPLHSLEQFKIQLNYVDRLLSKLANNTAFDNAQIIAAFKEIKANGDKLLDFARSSALSFIKPELQFNLELLELYSIKEKSPRFIEIISRLQGKFEEWLFFTDSVLDLAYKHDSRYIKDWYGLSRLQPGYIKELNHDIASTLTSLQSFLADFESSGKADFKYFSEKSRQFLESALPLFENIVKEAEINHVKPLAILLHQASLELSYFADCFQLLEYRYASISSLAGRCHKIISVVTEQLDYLNNVKFSLDRLLAPRNISRLWKDIEIGIEKIAVKKGHCFPAQYLYILDEYKVETRLQENAENNMVIHEEGDIFIINVEGLRDIELPYLVVAQKA